MGVERNGRSDSVVGSVQIGQRQQRRRFGIPLYCLPRFKSGSGGRENCSALLEDAGRDRRLNHSFSDLVLSIEVPELAFES